jgi:hypothetical protein
VPATAVTPSADLAGPGRVLGCIQRNADGTTLEQHRHEHVQTTLPRSFAYRRRHSAKQTEIKEQVYNTSAPGSMPGTSKLNSTSSRCHESCLPVVPWRDLASDVLNWHG